METLKGKPWKLTKLWKPSQKKPLEKATFKDTKHIRNTKKKSISSLQFSMWYNNGFIINETSSGLKKWSYLPL